MGEPPHIGICAKASILVLIFSSIVSAVIRAALK